MKSTYSKNTKTMKKNILSVSTMALLSLAACKKEDVKPETPDRSEHIYTFEASAAAKATLGENCVEWAEGDVIGTFAKGSQNASGRVNVGTPCTFPVKTVGSLAVGDKVYAYAPYSENAATDAAEVTFEIPADQSTDKIAMPLAARPFEMTEELEDNTETAVAGMNFYNLASVAELKLYASDGVASGEKIQSVTLTSTADICGSYVLDLTAIDPAKEETLALTRTSGAQTVTLALATPADIPASEGAALSLPVVLAPGTYPLTLTVVTDQASYIKTASEDLEFLRSHRKALVLDIASAKPSGMAITPAGLRSFGRGETLEYEIELTGITGDVTATAPEGWTATVDGTRLKVTASTDDTKALGGKVNVTIGKYTEELEVRRSGLNNQEDLVAFTTSVGNMLDDKFVKDIDAKYLDNEEISINADIEIPSASIAYGAYWLKRLRVPLNGNGHKLTINTTHGSRGGMVQNLGANVHDLNIDGTINAKDANAYVGGLACLLSADGLTVSNVTSTVNIVLGSGGCRAGGLIGAGDTTFGTPSTATLQNCHFDGSISANSGAYAIGGMLGALNAAIKTLNMNDCQFNGSISVSGNATAVGGMMGHAESKGVHAIFSGCKASSTAKITCRNGASKFIGGFVGAGGAATNPGEVMTMTDCSFEGTVEYIHINSVGVDGQIRIAGFIGNLERGAEFSNCKFLGKVLVDWANRGSLDGGGRGVGGFVGRTTAPNAGFPNMNARSIFEDCISKGTIEVTNSVDQEANNKLRIGHFVGESNNNTDSHKLGNCTFESAITVNGTVLTIEGK